jgi:hypothetical protein
MPDPYGINWTGPKAEKRLIAPAWRRIGKISLMTAKDARILAAFGRVLMVTGPVPLARRVIYKRRNFLKTSINLACAAAVPL